MVVKVLFYLSLLLPLGLMGQISTQDKNLVSLSTNQSLQPAVVYDLTKHEVPEYKPRQGANFYKIGYLIPFSQNLKTDRSNATILENGYLWRYEFKADNAQALNLYFEKYKIPQGAKMYISNKDGSQIIGAFTADNNNDNKTFACQLIGGDVLYLEYFEPFNAEFEGELVTNALGYMTETYKDQDNNQKDFGESGSCHVNVVCAEGNNKPEKDAVVRIIVKNGRWLGYCSGTIMNNTNHDCKPYVLTALHCAYDDNNNMATNTDFDYWIFYFGYQSATCNQPIREPYNGYTITGANVRAHSNDEGGEYGSDFLLLQLQLPIPNTYPAYFAGWDMSDNGRTNGGYSIHHPSGDIKKISTHTERPEYTSWGARVQNTHMVITWARTANGHSTTEGGSSGGPLFNNNGFVIGTLTGGWADCSNKYEDDFFGAMNYHYNKNGTDNNRNLKYWLANNSSIVIYGGASRAYCNFPSSVENLDDNIKINVFPNPSNGLVNIISTENVEIMNIQVFDILGKGVLHLSNKSNVSNLEIDLAAQANGIYFLQINTNKGMRTEKIILQK